MQHFPLGSPYRDYLGAMLFVDGPQVKIWGHSSVICVLKYAPFGSFVRHDSAVRKISHIFQYYKRVRRAIHIKRQG